jgi:hypothetical protein
MRYDESRLVWTRLTSERRVARRRGARARRSVRVIQSQPQTQTQTSEFCVQCLDPHEQFLQNSAQIAHAFPEFVFRIRAVFTFSESGLFFSFFFFFVADLL